MTRGHRIKAEIEQCVFVKGTGKRNAIFYAQNDMNKRNTNAECCIVDYAKSFAKILCKELLILI